ncbi:hypothetical protein R6Q59_002604 [Mikania micrantha]
MVPMQLQAILTTPPLKLSPNNLSPRSRSPSTIPSCGPCLTPAVKPYSPKRTRNGSKVLKDAPDLKAFHVNYRTQLQQDDELMNTYRSEPKCAPKKAYIKGNTECKLAIGNDND